MSGRAAGAQPWGLPQRVAMAGPGSLEGRWMWGVSERKATAAGPSATRRCRRRLLTMGNCGRDKPRKHLVHPHEPLSIANSRGAPRLDAGSLAGRVEGVAYLWRCLVVAAALRGIKGKDSRGGIAARRECSPGYLWLHCPRPSEKKVTTASCCNSGPPFHQTHSWPTWQKKGREPPRRVQQIDPVLVVAPISGIPQSASTSFPSWKGHRSTIDRESCLSFNVCPRRWKHPTTGVDIKTAVIGSTAEATMTKVAQDSGSAAKPANEVAASTAWRGGPRDGLVLHLVVASTPRRPQRRLVRLPRHT